MINDWNFIIVTCVRYSDEQHHAIIMLMLVNCIKFTKALNIHGGMRSPNSSLLCIFNVQINQSNTCTKHE